MSNPATSYYTTLGVERAADERTIKKAYFALVRKYPPETHPEDFKRIREAYEVLSNPVSRKDYDAIDQFDQYGADVSARLKSAVEAMDTGDHRRAQTEFGQLLEDQPQLHFARDLLGMSLLNSEQPAAALKQFDYLVSVQPDNAVYHLHKGYAHYAQKQHADAMIAYGRAREVDAADARVLVAMADCLVAQKQYEPALAELDKAIHLDGAVDFQDFIFFMRKVQIQILRNRFDLAETELDEIFKILPADAETRKYVATRLASLAADLFAMKRPIDANRLLERTRALDPTRKSLEFQFPASTKLRIATLPAASQAWLAEQRKHPSPDHYKFNAWVWPVLLALAVIPQCFGALTKAFGDDRLWRADELPATAFFLVGAPLLGLLAVRRLRRVARSPYGKYNTIHPFHLLQVNVDQVRVWPLVNLHDVGLTHHLTNGVYQHTAVKMNFAGTSCVMNIRGQQRAVEWANRLLAQRAKVLDLMAMGLLEAEEGMELVPPKMLSGADKPPPDLAARRNAFIAYGAAAAAGLALFGAAIPMNRARAEVGEWRTAEHYPGMHGFRRYLERFPSGHHVTEAHEGISRLYEGAIAKCRAGVGSARGAQAFVDVIETLRKGDTNEVMVRYEAELALPTPEATQSLGEALIQPGAAFEASLNHRREGSITYALGHAFDSFLSPEVIALTNRGKTPVTFVVKYRVRPSGTVYEWVHDKRAATGLAAPKGQKLLGILFDWDFAIRFDGEDTDRYHYQLTSAPAKDIRYTTYSRYDSNSDVLPYTKMAESAFEEFGRMLTHEFGVESATPSPVDRFGSTRPGGALGGAGGFGGDPGRMSREELDDLLRKLREREKRAAATTPPPAR